MTIAAQTSITLSPLPAGFSRRSRIYQHQGDTMTYQVDDVRIREIKELAPPSHAIREFPVSDTTERVTFETRQGIHGILHAADDRLLVIIGPCSIHDPKSALEYARRLAQEKVKHAADLQGAGPPLSCPRPSQQTRRKAC